VNYVYAYSAWRMRFSRVSSSPHFFSVCSIRNDTANHQKLRVPGLLPGITVSTSPTDFYPVQAVQLQRFKGESWELFGDIMHAESS